MYIEEIRRFLPHRYPFLLIDRVLDCVPGETLTAIKNVSVNEPFFTGHFPETPIMPGVLIIEALAQATGLLGFKTMSEEPSDDLLYMLVGVDNVRLKRQVVPGDQLTLKVKVERRSKVIWKFTGEASVDGQVVTTADLLCAAKEKE
ncbi:MAG: 3-hydroxyacyl-ACP dehydratase FabZ [Gammaproteobacteria bacterium]|nr:3-hydroxyacyl-ACP dehydratase FabZ [Gammaproteobacteria bacterium]